jgi:crotonobetainyl-CoA:carnitine CoA-transferase CaiB-like acyl-CoA transferase
MSTTSEGPLTGTTVVEVANFISGPMATMMLAQFGADVIKVEPPTGDAFRRFGRPTTGVSSVFVNSNRGKRSVVLDLKDEHGRDDLLRLLATADVFLTNWRPSVGAKLGLADDVLARANPRLIRAYVSGYGPTGPYVDHPVFDTVVQARSGMMDSQRAGDDPAAATTFVVDKVTAYTACQAVLAALVGRERTGAGDRIDIAMLDSASYFNFPDAMANRTFVEHQPADSRYLLAASVRPVRATDGWLMLVPLSGEQIRQCCHAVGHPEWIDDLRAAAPGVMTAMLFDLVESVTSISGDTAHWLATFAGRDVPVAPCHTLDEHLADDQVRHNELYAIGETPGVGPTRHIRYPAVSQRWGRFGVDGAAPALGEHQPSVFPGPGGAAAGS